MFRTLSDFEEFSTTIDDIKGAELTNRDVHVAVIALLAELANIDGDMHSSELSRIVECMNSEFDLTDADTGELMEICEFLRRDKKKLDDYFGMLNSAFTADHKIEVMRLLWLVILADKQIEKAEGRFAVEARTKLGLTLEQATRARALAQQGNRLHKMPESQ